MRIVSLQVRNLRAISDCFFDAGHGVNFIVGRNGAGKTTLLEAIFILARGKSFRSSRHGPLMGNHASEVNISCRLRTAGLDRILDYAYVGGKSRLCDNKVVVRRGRDLGERIQVRIVTENSQKLLEGQPDVRRLFLDWNLFHVERDYADLLSKFRRILAQRNAWLRNRGSGAAVWDDEYISLSVKLTELRTTFVDQLQLELDAVNVAALQLPRLRVTLRQGWPGGADLRDVLAQSFKLDARRGFTQYGPARADVAIQREGAPGIGSRGQSKVSAILFQLAAQRVFQSRIDTSCIWLLDDLRSELDEQRYETIFNMFSDTQQQIFLTSLDEPDVGKLKGHAKDIRMFHVEQGALLGRSKSDSAHSASA